MISVPEIWIFAVVDSIMVTLWIAFWATLLFSTCFTIIPCSALLCSVLQTLAVGCRVRRGENSECPVTLKVVLCHSWFLWDRVSPTAPAPTWELHLGPTFCRLALSPCIPGTSHSLSIYIPRSIFLLLPVIGLPHPPLFGFLALPSWS